MTTQEGSFLLAGTSYSGKSLDKKDDSKGGSDTWLIRINEFGDELWQKTLGTAQDEEARAVIQTTDLGFFVAGNVQNAAKGYGSKDILVTINNASLKVISLYLKNENIFSIFFFSLAIMSLNVSYLS